VNILFTGSVLAALVAVVHNGRRGWGRGGLLDLFQFREIGPRLPKQLLQGRDIRLLEKGVLQQGERERKRDEAKKGTQKHGRKACLKKFGGGWATDGGILDQTAAEHLLELRTPLRWLLQLGGGVSGHVKYGSHGIEFEVGRGSLSEFQAEDAKGPDIRTLVVRGPVLQGHNDLRSHPAGGTREGVSIFVEGGGAKVAQFNLSLDVNQDVPALDIAMDPAQRVNVLESCLEVRESEEGVIRTKDRTLGIEG